MEHRQGGEMEEQELTVCLMIASVFSLITARLQKNVAFELANTIRTDKKYYSGS